MKAILLDEAKKWLEENCENQYTRMAVFGIMQSMPTVDYQKTPNEPLTCDGCMYNHNRNGYCDYCIRRSHVSDYYRRLPEGEDK